MHSVSLLNIVSCFLLLLARIPSCIGQPRQNLRLYRDFTIAGLLIELSGDGFDNNRMDFDILVALVRAAGLTGVLGGGLSDVTVFAPTDEAFFQLAQEFGFTGNYDEEDVVSYLAGRVENIADGTLEENLQLLLTYHVASGAQSWRQLLNAGRATTVAGFEVGIRRNRRRRRQLRVLDDSRPHPSIIYRLSNYRVDGAFVHVINRVTIPPL